MAMHTCTRHYPHTPIIYNRISFFLGPPAGTPKLAWCFRFAPVSRGCCGVGMVVGVGVCICVCVCVRGAAGVRGWGGDMPPWPHLW